MMYNFTLIVYDVETKQRLKIRLSHLRHTHLLYPKIQDHFETVSKNQLKAEGGENETGN